MNTSTATRARSSSRPTRPRATPSRCTTATRTVVSPSGRVRDRRAGRIHHRRAARRAGLAGIPGLPQGTAVRRQRRQQHRDGVRGRGHQAAQAPGHLVRRSATGQHRGPGDLVYVLNAGGEGSVQGFELHKERLSRIEDANRSLGLHNGNPPAFASAPAQVKIDPDSEFVLVSTKNANVMFSYEIGRDGELSRNPVISDAGNTPFGFTFDSKDSLLVTESGANAVTRFELEDDGALDQIGPSVPNGQQAPCWIQRVGDYFFVANAGSSTISSYRVTDNGKLEIVKNVAADTAGGSIDMTTSDGFLYVQNATAGNVQGYEVNEDGSLKLVTTVEGLPKFADGIGMEGIAAS
ncbi:beta-propeller fold lactonase family protein [Micromonospora sp. M12]